MGRKNIPDKVRRRRKAQEAAAVQERALDPNVVVAGPPGWIVKAIQPARATKEYVCPGCTHEIREGVGHIVAWKPDDEEGRRHWHRGCWGSAKKRLR